MKIFLNITPALILFLSFYSLRAQIIPAISWQKSFGGSINETSNSVYQTFDGGFVVAGYSKSVNGDVTGNHGNQDYWVLKLDTAGNITWQRSLGGSDYDEEWGMNLTSDGGYIIAGQSKSNDGDVTGNHGLTDYWIVKLNAAGNIDWQKSLGGSDYDEAYAVSQTSDGGYIVAGNSESTDGNVSGHHGDYDFWVVKLDAAGNLSWQKSLGGSDEDECYAVQQTADGGFILAGGTESNDGDVSNNHGEQDVWIVKLDENGNLVWQKTLGGSSDEEALSLQQTTDGGFIVGGTSASSDGDVSGNHGTADYWIVKLDADGNITWQKSLGGSMYDIARSVSQLADGGFIAAGFSYSNDGDVSENFGLSDYWIARLDATGNLVWQQSLGGSNFDQANSIAQTTDGSFIIAGLSFSNDGDVTGNHDSTEDCWIVKLTGEAPEGIAVLSENSISMYPNPVQNQLTLELPGFTGIGMNSFINSSSCESIQVFDLHGRLMMTPVSLIDTHVHINTSALADGFYTIQITDSKTGNLAAGKFVKQH